MNHYDFLNQVFEAESDELEALKKFAEEQNKSLEETLILEAEHKKFLEEERLMLEAEQALFSKRISIIKELAEAHKNVADQLEYLIYLIETVKGENGLVLLLCNYCNLEEPVAQCLANDIKTYLQIRKEAQENAQKFL